MTLTLVPDHATHNATNGDLDLDALDPVEAGRVAWAHIAAGYRAALSVPGTDDDDHAMFLRCVKRAERIAGIPPVEAV